MAVRPIDANALHAEISKWPESVMYKDWVQSAIANAPTLTPSNEWVSVDEKLPNFGKLVIATDGTIYGIAWLCSDCTWMVKMGYKSQSWFGRKVTHWMPLPAPLDRRLPEGEA